MPLTLSSLRENKAALDAVATETVPKMYNRACYKPAYDSCYITPPTKENTVAQVVLNITESIGAGQWESRTTFGLRYNVSADGLVWPDDAGQWSVVPYRGIVEAWIDGLM